MLYPHLRKLLADRRGATAILIGVMAAMLIGFTSLGAEVVDALMTQRKMQAAADSAAISAANAQFIGSPSPYTQEGYAIAAADGFVAGQGAGCAPASPTVYVGAPCAGDPAANLPACKAPNVCVEVFIEQPHPLKLAKVVYAGDLTLHARAVAKVPNSTSGSCTLALQSTGTTITASGNGTITYGGCSIAANSTSPNAINTNGNNSLVVGTGVYTGGTEDWASMNVQAGSPTATQCTASNTNCVSSSAPQLNPYDDVVVPSAQCATYKNVPGGNSVTIGVVGAPVNCYKDITVNGNQSINLVPGTYVIQSTVKMTGSGSFLTCTSCVAGVSGVTIFLVGPNATVDITGGTSNLMAQPTGPYKGILFYSTETCSGGNCAKLTGGSTMTTQGAVILPNQNLSFNGNTATAAASVCTVLIAQTLTFTGTSNVGSTNCSTFNTQTVVNPGSLVE